MSRWSELKVENTTNVLTEKYNKDSEFRSNVDTIGYDLMNYAEVFKNEGASFKHLISVLVAEFGVDAVIELFGVYKLAWQKLGYRPISENEYDAIYATLDVEMNLFPIK